MPTLDEALETAATQTETPAEAPTGPKGVVTEPPAAPVKETPAPESEPAEAPVEEDASKLLILTPKTPEQKKEELTPEEQEKGYLRQADYTRKTQALAQERKELREREERYLKLLESRVAPPKAEGTGETIFDRIRNLREEGNNEEADKLIVEVTRAETRRELDPVIKNAKTQELQATFVNVAVQTAASNPVVQRYAKAVGARFDGDEVLDAATGLTMTQLRQAVTTDRDTMVRFVPIVMRALAMEEHARALESEMKKTIDTRVAAGLAAEQARAKKLPSQLVPSGSVTKTTSPGKMSLDEALSAAAEQLSSQ